MVGAGLALACPAIFPDINNGLFFLQRQQPGGEKWDVGDQEYSCQLDDEEKQDVFINPGHRFFKAVGGQEKIESDRGGQVAQFHVG